MRQVTIQAGMCLFWFAKIISGKQYGEHRFLLLKRGEEGMEE